MFDIGFAELMIVALVALLVLGPERLPKAARTVGYWGGRARRYMSQMTAELEREVQQAEIREKIEKTRAAFNQKVDLDAMVEPDRARKSEESNAATSPAKKPEPESVSEGPADSDDASSARVQDTQSAWERAAADAEAMEAELDAELALEREEAEARARKEQEEEARRAADDENK